MDIFSKCFTYSYANELRAQGLYPYFHALETRQGRRSSWRASAASCSVPTITSA